MKLRNIASAVETTVVWLFLLQALRGLFASLFGVIYDAVFDQTTSSVLVTLDLALVLLAMLTPLLLRRLGGRVEPRVGAALLVLVARLFLSLEDPTLRLYASILLLGGAAFYVAQLLWHEPGRLMTGFVLGLGADQLLRAWDYTYDPTLRLGGLPFVVGLAIITAILTLYGLRDRRVTPPHRPPLIAGLALGAALFVQTAFLALPNALTHWSGVGYDWTAPLLLLVSLMPLWVAVRNLELQTAIWLWPLGGILSTGLILVSLVLAGLLGGILSLILLLVAQLLFLLNVTSGIVKREGAPRTPPLTPGLGVSLGLILLLSLNVAFAFTFTYPYTLSFFRGLGTPILLVAAFISVLPVINLPLEPEVAPTDPRVSISSLVGSLLLVVACALLTRAPALPERPAPDTVRLATFNIHYGFGEDWAFNLDEMAAAIDAAGVDVILLQEVDAGRVTSFSVDDALWLGRYLDMEVVYQPTLEKLSGIALLSRYPLSESGGRWLSSDLEQTAVVYGTVETVQEPLYVYGIWLGLTPAERAAQLAEALDYVGARNPVALGGDFNATPDSPIYARMLEQSFVDPFGTLGAEPAPTSPAENPTERIDYVWLRGLAPRRAWVSDVVASDHRLVVVEVQLNP